MPTRRGRGGVVPVTPPIEALWISVLAATTANTAASTENTTELRQLREALTRDREHRSRPATKSYALLLILAASVADKAFSAKEVMERAALLDVALRDALAVAGLDNPRRLGKWLRTVEGREIAGLRLERIGTDHDGIVWRVFRV